MGARNFLCSKTRPDRRCGSASLLLCVTGILPGVKLPEPEVRHLPSSSFEVRTEWSCISVPPLCVFMERYKENSTYYAFWINSCQQPARCAWKGGGGACNSMQYDCSTNCVITPPPCFHRKVKVCATSIFIPWWQGYWTWSRLVWCRSASVSIEATGSILKSTSVDRVWSVITYTGKWRPGRELLEGQ
jgi:hypothetical protein